MVEERQRVVGLEDEGGEEVGSTGVAFVKFATEPGLLTDAMFPYFSISLFLQTDFVLKKVKLSDT